MADVQSLPPDQKAALQLLLKQGQSYEQIAGLLGIEPSAVRRRAHAALESLSPDRGPGEDQRGDVADYLLGQQGVSERERTRALLDESASARSWARAVASELEPLAGGSLPDLPGGAAAPERADGPDEEPVTEPRSARDPIFRPRGPGPVGRADDGDDDDGDDEEPAYARAARDPGPPGRASRLGGALLLGGIGVVIAVVLVILLSGGNDDNSDTTPETISRTGPTTATTGTGTGTGTTPTPVAQVNLTSPQGGERTIGLVSVFASGSDRAIIARGQGLPAGAYALWLYNSASDAQLLGFVPNRIGNDGAFQTQGVLPKNVSKWKQIVVTRENVTTSNSLTPPKQPGTIVRQGDLKLG
ncbi:MAG: RNA polymerase sigma factor [Solirubrobacteraceae bacterium]